MAKTHLGGWIIELDEDTGGIRIERFAKPGRVNIEAAESGYEISLTQRDGTPKDRQHSFAVSYIELEPQSKRRRGRVERVESDRNPLTGELWSWSMQRVK